MSKVISSYYDEEIAFRERITNQFSREEVSFEEKNSLLKQEYRLSTDQYEQMVDRLKRYRGRRKKKSSGNRRYSRKVLIITALFVLIIMLIVSIVSVTGIRNSAIGFLSSFDDSYGIIHTYNDNVLVIEKSVMLPKKLPAGYSFYRMTKDGETMHAFEYMDEDNHILTFTQRSADDDIGIIDTEGALTEVTINGYGGTLLTKEDGICSLVWSTPDHIFSLTADEELDLVSIAESVFQ